MAHFLNVKYSIVEGNGHYSINVEPGEDPGMTEITYLDGDKIQAMLPVEVDQLPLLIEALQRRHAEAKKEVEDAYGPPKK